MKTFIIAEAGVNHNGSLNIAKKLIDAAVFAGADAVKFQTFIAKKLVTKTAPKAQYQKTTTNRDESQLSMIQRLELGFEAHKQLIDHCKKSGILFLSSAFDLESIDLLVNLGLKIFKIPSGEITNLPYLKKIGRFNKKVILSTGMSDIREIKAALALITRAGTSRKNIALLHCNTAYPTPFRDVNLRALPVLKRSFGIKVGYSDHTPGVEVSIAAVALGAEIIEKHMTLDKNMPGPDHRASLDPKEFKAMVSYIRNIENALGSGKKIVTSSEKKNIGIVRKSIIAATDIKKGEIFTQANITAKRPGTGISPMKWKSIIGKRSARDFRQDELIKL